MQYPVLEIFDSIQGEGSMMGMPVTFIRFAGCNLACPWCDTKDSWGNTGTTKGLKDPLTPVNVNHKFTNMTAEEIVTKVTQKIVVLTGGEPCLQDLETLIALIHDKDEVCMVSIETNGTLPTPENADWVTCSPKPPEYKIHERCFFNELKYVMDENFDLSCVPEANTKQMGSIWLQPCDFGVGQEEKTKASYQRAAELPLIYPFLRTGIQLHKILQVK